jgi:hypothetical protein
VTLEQIKPALHAGDHGPGGEDAIWGLWVTVGTRGVDGVDAELADNPQPYAVAAASYEFDSSTSDSSPGDGVLRLGSTPQNTSTALRISKIDGDGARHYPRLTTYRIEKATDPSSFITFDATGYEKAGPGYGDYWDVTGSVAGSSGGSPFADADALTVVVTDPLGPPPFDLGSDWTQLGGGFEAFGFRWSASGRVEFRGALDSPTMTPNSLATTLPERFRDPDGKTQTYECSIGSDGSGRGTFTYDPVSGQFVFVGEVTGEAGTDGADGIDGVFGGAISIPFTFSTTTTNSDPGSGNLRLDNATQNTATKIRVDLLDVNGTDWTTVIDSLDDSTNTVKGEIRLVKTADQTKFLVFNVSAVDSSSGYRNITVANTGSSASSPFSNGDTVMLCFTRAGDAGATGGSGSQGAELSYTAVTSSVTVNGSGITVVTLPSITFDGSPVLLHFFCAQVQAESGPTGLTLSILEGATTIGQLLTQSGPTAQAISASLWFRFTPSAGAHTYVLKSSRFGGSGSPSFSATSTQPMFVRITKV